MEKVTKFKVINFNNQIELYDTEGEALKAEKEIECYKELDKKVRENIGYSDYQNTTVDFIWDNAEWLYKMLEKRFK